MSQINIKRITQGGAALLTASALLWSCQAQQPPAPKPKHVIQYAPIDAAAVKVVELSTLLEPALERELSFGVKAIAKACHQLFEPHERPLEQWPFDDKAQEATQLAACKPESSIALSDGGRAIAYALPAKAGSSAALDLRLAVYDAKGQLQWSHRVGRAEQGNEFLSNFRDSFALELKPYLICTGTAWELNIQVHCLDRADGQVRWQGLLPFWSGIPTQAFGMSLYFADLSGLRRHYPYNGVEQRFRRLDGPGGRLGIYATDGQRLYFGPNRGGPYTLTAYDFKSMSPVWGVELGVEMDNTQSLSAPDEQTLILKHQRELWALDTQQPQLLWRLKVEEDRPQLARIGQTLFVLWRRADQPNILAAFNLRDASLQWWAKAPTGTLRISALQGQLVLNDIDSAQQLTHPTPQAAPTAQKRDAP